MRIYDHKIPLRVIYGGFVANISVAAFAFGIPFWTEWDYAPLGLSLWIGLSTVCFIFAVLFMFGVKWTRIALSVLLHVSLVALIYGFFWAMFELRGTVDRVSIGALYILGAGDCVLGILLLHGRSLKNEFGQFPHKYIG